MNNQLVAYILIGIFAFACYSQYKQQPPVVAPQPQIVQPDEPVTPVIKPAKPAPHR